MESLKLKFHVTNLRLSSLSHILRNQDWRTNFVEQAGFNWHDNEIPFSLILTQKES
jgi:hypothetical protein